MRPRRPRASSLDSAKWVKMRVLIRCGDCRRDRRGRMGMGACCLRLSVCHSDECRWMDDVGWRCGQTHRHGHCQTLYFPPLVSACVGIQLWQGGPHRSSHSLTASHPPFLRRPWTIPSSPSQSARSLARSVVVTPSSTLLFIHTCTAAGSAGCIACSSLLCSVAPLTALSSLDGSPSPRPPWRTWLPPAQLAVANGRWRDSPSLRRASASTFPIRAAETSSVDVGDDSAGEGRHRGGGGRVHRAERTAGCVVRHCRPAQRISLHL